MRGGRTKDGLRPVCHPLHERVDEINDVQPHETDFETAQLLDDALRLDENRQRTLRYQ